MADDSIRKYLKAKVKRDFLVGKITGDPIIPTDAQVDNEVERIVQESRNGIIGKMNAVRRRAVSDPDQYGDNFRTIKDNVEYVMGEVSDEVNNVIDQINNSTVEKNNAIRTLRNARGAFQEVETGRLTDDGLSYTISDSFVDLSKIDMERSTAEVNPSAGTVALSHHNAKQLQFPHYRSQTGVVLTLTEGQSFVLSQQQIPGTTFGGIFDSDDTERWEYVITTTEPTKVQGYITLKLSEVGDTIDVNEVNIKLAANQNTDGVGLLWLEFFNAKKDDLQWHKIPGAISEMTSQEINFRFKIPATTHIRLYFSKDWPDDMATNEYYFGISELVVRRSETVYESVLVSKSLEIEPYRREAVSVFSAMVSADQKVVPGTKIRYYVGIDEPISGKIVDSAGNKVDIDSPDAYEIVPNGTDAFNDPENYYVYASQLRDRIWISGSLPYKNWQPRWQEVSPINSRTAGVPSVRFFNTSIINKGVHDIYYYTPLVWGDPGYTGPWPVASYTGTWADDWDDTPAGFPQSGYIWGESPFTTAGVWWGGNVENPGWWRPHVPSASGTQTWTDVAKFSTPDYILPVYNDQGFPVWKYNQVTHKNEPVQKHFWKVFKWPNSFLPIPGSVKLFSSAEDESDTTDTTIGNKQTWQWNFKSKEGVKNFTTNFEVKEGENFHTIKLEDLIDDEVGLKILKGSISNLRFTDYEPSVVEDFSIDYGHDYVTKEDGTVSRTETPAANAAAHATISFTEALSSYIVVTGDKTPEMAVDLQYISTDALEASWETYVYVPQETTVGTTFGRVNDNGGFVSKVIVDSLDEYGIIISSLEILAGSSTEATISKFPVNLGWSKIRVFTAVDLQQVGVTDSSIAKWNPNKWVVTRKDGAFLTGTNDNKAVPNVIKMNSINFAASGVVENTPITLRIQTNAAFADLTTLDGIITNVNTNELKVKFTSLNVEHPIESFTIPNFDKKYGFAHENLKLSMGEKPLREVDLYTLMNETAVENDGRFAIVEDVDRSKYLVVKTPNDQTFPNGMHNKLHYSRSYYSSASGMYLTFTTGTSGNTGAHPTVVLDDSVDVDINGVITYPYVDDRPSNTVTDTHYENISTYGENLQVADMGGSGFLFWDTAENLQSYYRIEYAVPVNNRPCGRIMVMAKMTADTEDVTPLLNSYNIIINSKEDVRRSM